MSKTDIQLWTSTKASTKSKDPLNVTQTFIPIKPRKTVIAGASHRTIKQTRRKQPPRRTSSNKLPSFRFKTINKLTRCKTASPKPSSRITRAQKIQQSGTKSPTFKISVHGLKRYKHRYSYKCMVNPCNRQFATVRDWNRHHQLFHRFHLKCVECRKRFATPSSRRDHMYSHRAHQYKCTICKRSFYFLSELQLHKTVHHKTKYYRCLKPNCGKTYKWKQDLMRHAKSHEKERFNCESCDYSSTEKRLLKRHVLIHSLKKTYHCVHCNKRYRHYNSLNRHMHKCTG